jgi:hypothetical protein
VRGLVHGARLIQRYLSSLARVVRRVRGERELVDEGE